MTNAKLPGRFNKNGGERVDTRMHRVTLWTGCQGSCKQGREACDCSELANRIPSDASRSFKPSPRLSANLRALAAGIGGIVAFALILALVAPGVQP